MSPKENNKKVSAAVRILHQKRDASARATHLMVKNDPLITYEKAFEGQAAVKKFFIATFLERKIMSTKTSFKRIALVAASALAIAGFSAVPANAASTRFQWNASAVSQTAGSPVVVSLDDKSTGAGTDTVTFTITGTLAGTASVTAGTGSGGSAVTSDLATDTTQVYTFTQSTGAKVTIPFTVTSTTAGTLVISAVSADQAGLGAAVTTVTFTGGGASTGATIFAPKDDYQTRTPDNITSTSYVVTQTASTSGWVKLGAYNEWAIAGSSGNLTVTGGAISATTPASAAVTCTGTGGSTYTTTLLGATLSSTGAIGAGSLLGSNIDASVWLDNNGCNSTDTRVNTDASFKIAATTAGTITAVLTTTAPAVAGVTQSPVYQQSFTIIVAGSAANVAAVDATIDDINSGVNTTAAPVSTVVAPASATAPIAVVQVTNKINGTTLSSTTAPALTVAITGPGLISTEAGGGTISTYLAFSQYTWSDKNIYVWSDSRAGTSTVTVSAGGNVIKAFTVIFTGKVASITPVALMSIGKSGGATTGALITGALAGSAVITNTNAFGSASATNNPAIALVFKDSLGAVIPVLSGITALSSSAAVVSTPIKTSFVDDGQGDGSVAFGYVHTTFETALLAASGQSATITYSYINADGTLVTSTPVKITIGGSAAKEVMTLDSASYEPGAPMTLTITATDSSGNPVYDGATGPVLTSNKSLGGTLPSAGTYVGGKLANKANKLFAPATTGDFTILGAGTDAAATALSLTATVEKDQDASLALDAANAATDAANNAYDEAQNATQAASDALAAVTALAAQVKSLIAMVKKLTKAVAKMNKKKK